MSYEVAIEFTVDAPPDAENALQTAVVTALSSLEVTPNAEGALLLADDATLQALNRRFRQEDHPTDVLSFAAEEPPAPPGFAGPVEPTAYLGDIAISVPTAQRQATQQGHGLVEELQLLAVHGVLHLLGYDHATAAEKAAMWQQQRDILATLGLSHVQPSEGEYES
jgi:probable rRNA maturation factor